MTVLLVLVGCLAAFFGGCWLAVRRSPVLCNSCGLFIACDEWDGHEARCVAQHEPVGAGGFLPSPAPTRLQCSDVDWTDAVRSLTLTGEDDAARRTVLSNEDDPT